jgi:hypothetical protein
MGWPAFRTTTILQRAQYWPQEWIDAGPATPPRILQPPLRSRQLYVDATPTSRAAVAVGPPRLALVSRYTDTRPIAFPEMAAALKGLIWYMRTLDEPTTITLYTDSSIVYYFFVRGIGVTSRRSLILQQLYYTMFKIKIQAGHGLVVRWVPSSENLAGPLSRGVHPATTWSARI